MKKSEERARFEQASAICAYCRWLSERNKGDLCPDHTKRLQDVEGVENRRVIERSKLPPLPPPPPLPPRRR